MPIDLYFLELSPPCRAVQMTARHLDIELNIKTVDLLNGEQMTPEYLKLNPAHTVPVMVDEDVSLWESRAIMQYLCNRYAPDNSLYPKDAKTRAVVDRWLYTDLSFFLANKDALVMPMLFKVVPTEQMIDNYKKTLTLLDTLIGDRQYLAGNAVTIADLSVVATTTMLAFNEYQDIDNYPNLKRWFESMQKELNYYDEINGNIDQIIKNLKSNQN